MSNGNPQYIHLAVDLGAESGRVMLGTVNQGRIILDELHRFSNNPLRLHGELHWNLLAIYQEILIGLRKAASLVGTAKVTISVDSWGVDYVWFNASTPMLSLPWHYRDDRSKAHYEALSAQDKDLIFSETGIQFMSLNTLYQILAEQKSRPDLFNSNGTILTIADYLNYCLCGVVANDESSASTTQMYNPKTRTWSEKLAKHFNYSTSFLPKIVPSGTPLGNLIPSIKEDIGFDAEVIASCSHDTAAAVAAVPAHGENWAFLSSGTWSLLGLELNAPVTCPAIQKANFTNEAGYGGKIRFLKNIAGLWILQECRRFWIREGSELDYLTIARLASIAEPFRSLINPADPRFLEPGFMPEKIAAYCKESGQPEPSTPGQFARCIFESLALNYGAVLQQTNDLTGKAVSILHIVGGGGKNALLNQLTANACGCDVLSGPVEGTALGNIAVQAIACGIFKSIDEARDTIRLSSELKLFKPADSDVWDGARKRFATLPCSS